MKAHFAAIALLAAGCQNPPGPQAQDLQHDAMVVTLPAHTTLIGGLSPAALLDHPDLLALAMPHQAALNSTLAARTGLHDLHAADEVRLGCGADGCVVLASGDFSALDAQRLAGTAPAQLRASAHPRGLDLRTADGPFVMRRLTPHKLVLGDRRAVRAIAREQHHASVGNHRPRIDLAPLEGLVPPGDLWLAAHSPEHLAQHMSTRLRRSQDPSAHRLAATVERFVEENREDLQRVDAVAASVNLESEAALQLRVRCATEAEARRLTTLATARLLLPSPLPASVQRSARVTQHERVVELRAELDLRELDQEVSP